MADDASTLSEMETRLADDADGSYCGQLCSQLDSYAAEVRRQLDSGLVPEEFARASKLNDALATAVDVVRAQWQASACTAS